MRRKAVGTIPGVSHSEQLHNWISQGGCVGLMLYQFFCDCGFAWTGLMVGLSQGEGADSPEKYPRYYLGLRIAFLSFLQLFRKGAKVAEAGGAGICTEPSAAPGAHGWMQQTPQASSGESQATNTQSVSSSSTCLFHLPLEVRRQDSSFSNHQDLVNSIGESSQAGKDILGWNIHVCFNNSDFFLCF